MRSRAARSTAKLVIDRCVAFGALVASAPVMALTAVGVRLTMGSPVLFTQLRPGLEGAPFKLVKFRTMSDARDADGKLAPDERRLTRFGRFLRSWSLDELPQLWNVLVGEMSLVGPRPLLMCYLERYSPEQARRLRVRPGLTGWAQVNGRNAVGWRERFALDVWYVDHWSLWLDARILVMTVAHVLQRQGSSFEPGAIVHEFTGDEPLSEEALTPPAGKATD